MTTRTLRTLASAIAAMGLLVGSAAALEVASSATVAGKPDAVWQKIGDFCAIQSLASRHIEVRAERGRWCDPSHAHDY